MSSRYRRGGKRNAALSPEWDLSVRFCFSGYCQFYVPIGEFISMFGSFAAFSPFILLPFSLLLSLVCFIGLTFLFEFTIHAAPLLSHISLSLFFLFSLLTFSPPSQDYWPCLDPYHFSHNAALPPSPLLSLFLSFSLSSLPPPYTPILSLSRYAAHPHFSTL